MSKELTNFAKWKLSRLVTIGKTYIGLYDLIDQHFQLLSALFKVSNQHYVAFENVLSSSPTSLILIHCPQVALGAGILSNSLPWHQAEVWQYCRAETVSGLDSKPHTPLSPYHSHHSNRAILRRELQLQSPDLTSSSTFSTFSSLQSGLLKPLARMRNGGTSCSVRTTHI